MKPFIVDSCGIGNDSIALLIEARRRKLRPDLIVFADTGSEHPRTLKYITTLQEWLARVGFPPLDVVRWVRKRGRLAGQHVPIHSICEARRELPSAAYGYAGCSDKWKRQPIDQFVNSHPAVIRAKSQKRTVERWIGFNADEGHRLSGNLKRDGYRWRAPLVEWDIGRTEVRQIIRCSSLPLPGKSSCWLCPHMTAGEVLDLRREHPALFKRALKIESGANLERIKGLGRSAFSWAELDRQARIQGSLFTPKHQDAEDLPCMCAT